MPEVEIGILPSSGGTHRLVGLLAWRLGLVTEVCADPLRCALELAARLASLPQLAVRVTGEVVDAMAARLPR